MKSIILKLTVLMLLLIAVFWACKSREEQAYSYLPTDVKSDCFVNPKDFDLWFVSGKATENGAVKPVNSVTFKHENNCEFYQWSEQMFLWLTSKGDGSYGDGKRVFESPVFYTVSPEDISGKRILIAHKKGLLLSAVPSLEKSVGLDSEQGQATGDALMSKDGSIVYYITMVNNVYAQFLTAVKNKSMSGERFPTSLTDLARIEEYARMNHVALPDASALAMEIKSSWVEATTVKDLSSYVTIDAMIPTYAKTPAKWTITGQRKAKLAMLGLHIVGSTAGHPEMVWSTFEHKETAPNLSYTYLDKNGHLRTVKADTDKEWVLNSKPSDTTETNINISHMKFKGDSIYANFKKSPKGNTVSPSNSTRVKPWGVADNGIPNKEDTSVAASNSQIISINNSIQSLLKGNDVRKNYLFIGSTWTDSGTAPDGTSYSATNTKKGVAIGTSQLANTTMETYIQNGTGYNSNGSCFYCHHDSSKNGPSLSPGELSHVFGDILPLTANSNWKGSILSPKQ